METLQDWPLEYFGKITSSLLEKTENYKIDLCNKSQTNRTLHFIKTQIQSKPNTNPTQTQPILILGTSPTQAQTQPPF